MKTFRPLIMIPMLSLGMGAVAQQVQLSQWPIAFEADGYQVKVYTPQPEAIDGDRFQARAAVSLLRSGEKVPVFGAIWGEGQLAVDRATRLGTLTQFEVGDVRFPEAAGRDKEALKAMFSREIPRHAPPIAIDWLVAALDSELDMGTTYLNDAPEIIYTERPSVLVFIDGEPEYLVLERRSDHLGDPVYAGISKDIERVLNTPYLLLRYRKDQHYLYGSGHWFRSTSITGPYAQERSVPIPLQELAREVDKTAEIASGGVVPEIVVRTTPAVLLDLNGPPSMQPIQGVELLYATNTDKDLFLEIATQEYYLVASGRWYSTRDPRNGPWRHVPAAQLPGVFARIPEGSAKDGVLAHVPGTNAAREAVRDAYIPQTASVDRQSATLEVKYDGEPVFERIDGTNVHLAVNANTTVLRIGGHYHACHNAVWFDSSSPFGPWMVSTEVPSAVNDIPPGSPAYHVRYVYIYDWTPDVVFVGYTPGYLGCYVQGGVVILGTGFYYPRWPRFWYPRPFTWGFPMYYDPWIGWTFGYGWGWYWYYPSWMYWGWYGPAGPWYGWGAWGWWGPWSYSPPWRPEPRPVYYGHRPSLSSTRPPATAAQADLYSNVKRPGVRPTTVDRPSMQVEGRPTKPVVRPSKERDHIPDRDGNIFRRDNRDRIERYDDGRWQRIPREKPRTDPTPPRTIPRSIFEQRDRGDQRVRDLEHYRQRPAAPAPAPRPAPAPQRQAPQRKR
ncbi:MAG: hypothetical protein KIT10_07035 [Flavobacteriales bacterium]|nr:hypothetical protein [Flavobacteriales bacterium]